MGSNKVLRVALGSDAATEYRTNLSELAERCRGCSGLFFTKLPREEVCRGVWVRWRALVLQAAWTEGRIAAEISCHCFPVVVRAEHTF